MLHVRNPFHHTKPGIAVDSGIVVDIVSDVREFKRLHADWDALFRRAGQPHQLFQRHAPLAHWANHYLPNGDELFVIAARKSGRLVMVWPFVRTRRCGVAFLTVMGQPISQFDDVLAEPDVSRAEAGAVWEAIRQSGADVVLARNMRADSALAALLPEDLPVTQLSAASAPYANLAARATADGPGKAYSPKYRSDYRRKLRRLGEQANVAFVDDCGANDRVALAQRAVELKRRSLGRRALRRSPVFDERFGAFFRDLARDEKNGADLRFSAIEADGVAVAMDMSFDCKGRTFGFLTVYDDAFSSAAPGTVLLHHTFAAAQRRGNAIMEMLPPAHGYKLQHADGEVGVADCAVALSTIGRAAVAADQRLVRPARRLARKAANGVAS